jgi:hypothetical protein
MQVRVALILGCTVIAIKVSSPDGPSMRAKKQKQKGNPGQFPVAVV